MTVQFVIDGSNFGSPVSTKRWHSTDQHPVAKLRNRQSAHPVSATYSG